MKIVFGAVLMIWSIFTFAKDYPEVIVAQEDGFVDLQFKISSLKKLQSGNTEFVVKGTLNHKNVGFAIELLPNWDPKKIEGFEQPFCWGAAIFKETGPETSAFIVALSNLYGNQIKHAEAHPFVPAEAVGLACNPEDILNTPCKMKLFFNSDSDESLYSEVFLNVDVSAKILELNEKDNEYRVPLIKSLTK
ncbi:hypothetical protein L2703_18580 [Shewanella basaltis]|uniref:hypothetical protein n=1 Tax=Shewanella basaltis TaxID=472183 RepID=UPI00200C9FE8|nr:hypothetical protein [Shewanella basaltis]MCL1115572.1 hypothetical protein [Shewanella basaltis]